MRRRPKLVICKFMMLMAALLFLWGCGARTVVLTEWADPEFQSQKVTRILLVGIGNKAVGREVIEKKIEEKLVVRGVDVVAGAGVIPDEGQLTQETINFQAKSHGVQAILISQASDFTVHEHPRLFSSRMTRVGKRFDKATSVDSIYLDSQRSDLIDSRFFATDSRAQVDTSSQVIEESHIYLYNRLLTPEKNDLIWHIQTDTANPESPEKAVEEGSGIIVGHLAQSGLIP